VVTDVDQLILVLSIPQMWNVERNIMVFELECILIIIACGLEYIEKRGNGLRFIHTLLSWIQLFGLGEGGIRFAGPSEGF